MSKTLLIGKIKLFFCLSAHLGLPCARLFTARLVFYFQMVEGISYFIVVILQ